MEEEVQYYRSLRLGTGRNPCTDWSSRNLDKLNSCHQEGTAAKGKLAGEMPESLRHYPIDRCKRSLATSRVDACRFLHATEVPDEGQDWPERIIPDDVQGLEGTRVVVVHLSRRRGNRRPPRPVRDRSAAAEDRGHQPEGPKRGERSPAEAGWYTLEVPPGKERPAVGGGGSTRTSSEDSEAEREERTGDGVRTLGRFFLACAVPPLDERQWHPP